jgi:hypothetical protein
MIAIDVNDVVAASLAAAGACLILSIPRAFMVHLMREFPGWVVRTYGKGALALPVLGFIVLARIVMLAVQGDFDGMTGLAMMVAVSCLGLVFASALLRFYLSDYRKSR